VNFRTFTILTF